jgi:hypothetical protein
MISKEGRVVPLNLTNNDMVENPSSDKVMYKRSIISLLLLLWKAN